MGGAMAARWKTLDAVKHFVIIDPHSGMYPSARDIPADFVPDVVVFGIKPQNLEEALQDYTHYTHATFLSIAAGKNIAFFQKHLGATAKIVRAMPNLPASVGEGMTIACHTPNLSPQEKTWANLLLQATGKVLWVEDEAMIDPMTTLSGCGPAYFFLMVETLVKAGATLGIDAAQAEALARQTLIGSAALLQSVATPASELRENVTSKKGVTEAALNILMAENGMQPLFNTALQAAVKRAKELAN